MTMPRGSDIYKNPWLKAEDLRDDEETFTITGSDIHTFDDNGKEKAQIVLMFRETEKKLGLNVTNYTVLKQIFQSDDSDDWHGKQVVLFVTQTTMTDGRQVDCLRIKRKATEKLLADRTRLRGERPASRAAAPKQTAPPLTQAEVDDGEEIPF
jgi:hypothetical protein